MNVYAYGQSVLLTCTFRAASLQPGEPASASLKVRRPDGTMLTFRWPDGTLARNSDGQYVARVTADQRGRWLAWIGGTGTDGSTPSYQWYFDVQGGLD